MSTLPHNSAAAAVLNLLSCARCQYMLRGLDPAGVCPECGLPIVDTIDREIQRELDRRQLLLGARRPDPPAHPPLAGARRGVGVRRRAGTAAWAGHYGRRWALAVDPERLFLAAWAAYLLGAWLLTWPARLPLNAGQ